MKEVGTKGLSDGIKALSVRQPWAWLILNGGKDIENRTWSTKYRGRFLVHAAKGMTRKEYNFAYCMAVAVNPKFFHDFPKFEDLERGGIVGSVELVDVVEPHERTSEWHMMGGFKGFKLAHPKSLPLTPMKGKLGFFWCAMDGLTCVDGEAECEKYDGE